MYSKPSVIPGGISSDERGVVCFVNDFDFKYVDRFYWVRAHQAKKPRGWVGHRREHKWFSAVAGTVLLFVVQPDTWVAPSSDLPVQRFTLSSTKPTVLHIPPGYATASLPLTEEAILLIFSSGKIENANEDNYRFPLSTWQMVE